MATLKLDKNRGYLITGIGAFVALFAFLYLPYVTLSATSATNFASSGGSYSVSVTSTMAANGQGGIWLEGILALTILVLACLLLFRTNPFGSSRTPIINQIRWGIYGLGGGAIFCIVVQFLVSLSLAGSAGSEGFGGSGSSGNVTAFYDYGSWLYLLGMIAVIVGSVIAYRKSGLVSLTPAVSSYQAQTPFVSAPYAAPGSSPYDMPYPSSAPQGSVPLYLQNVQPSSPYQQNVQPSSPYDAQGVTGPSYPPDAGMRYPYQESDPRQPQVPPQQWPPSYPSS